MENKQFTFVQVPHDMTEKSKLKPMDLLVYANIRRHCNKTSKIGWPSYKRLSELCGLCVPTIKRCIDNLVAKKYIEVSNRDGKNYYRILKDLPFEVFSLEFLDNKDLTPQEKAYILASQQYCFKDDATKTGIIKYSNHTLADKLNVSVTTVNRCNRSLEQKGFLELISTGMGDMGKQTKIFKLSEFGQAIVFALDKHEKQIKPSFNVKINTELNNTHSNTRSLTKEGIDRLLTVLGCKGEKDMSSMDIKCGIDAINAKINKMSKIVCEGLLQVDKRINCLQKQISSLQCKQF